MWFSSGLRLPYIVSVRSRMADTTQSLQAGDGSGGAKRKAIIPHPQPWLCRTDPGRVCLVTGCDQLLSEASLVFYHITQEIWSVLAFSSSRCHLVYSFHLHLTTGLAMEAGVAFKYKLTFTMRLQGIELWCICISLLLLWKKGLIDNIFFLTIIH